MTTLTNGTINVSATSTISGVTSSAATTSFVLDTQAPSAPVFALGSGVSDGATADEATQLGGVVTIIAENGSTGSTTFTNGTHTVTKAFIGTGASQAVTLTSSDLSTLTDGTISVSATATDAAGNLGATGTTSFVLNTTAITTTADNWLGLNATSTTPTQSNNYQGSYYDWATSSNWSVGVPTASSNVWINGQTNSPTLNSSATISSLTLNAGYLYEGSSGNLSVTNAINLAGNSTLYVNSGTLTASSLALSSNSYSSNYLYMAGGRFTANSSSITYGSNGGYFSVNGYGEVNLGSVTVNNNSGNNYSNFSLNLNASSGYYYSSSTTGTLKVTGALSNFSYVSSSISSGFTLELNNTGTGNFNTDVSFSGTNAVLKLDTPTSYAGKISNFALTDKIDLVGVIASSVSYDSTSSTLTVNRAGTSALTFNLSGALLGEAVTSSSDGSGGTLISFSAPAYPTPVITLGTGVSNGATAAEATQSSGVITITGQSGVTETVTFINGSHSVTKTLTGNGSAQAVTLSSADLTTLTDGTIKVSAVSSNGAGAISSTANSSFT